MFNMFDIASIELLVNNHGTAHERKIWQTLKTAVLAQQTNNSAMDAMREIRAVINGRGDSVTKVLKCKDILARHQ